MTTNLGYEYEDLWVEGSDVSYRQIIDVFKFGSNLGVGTVNETIWSAGGKYTWLDLEAEAMYFASTSVNDTADGTGAKGLLITGLDDNGDIYDNFLPFNGQTPVLIPTDLRRFLRGECFGHGVLATNDGVIWIGNGAFVDGVPANKYGHILAGFGQTLMGIMTVPRGYRGYIKKFFVTVDQGKSAQIEIRTRALGQGGFTIKAFAPQYQNILDYTNQVKYVMPGLTDFEASAKAETGTLNCSVISELKLVKDL